MKTNRNQVLAVLGIAALAVSLPMAAARAQAGPADAPSEQQAQPGGPPPPPGGQFGGQRGGLPQNPPAGPGGGFQQPNQVRAGAMLGGNATMVLDNSHLYILRGNTLYRVNKSDLRVSATGELPMPSAPRGGATRADGGQGGLE
jgi:hypothetical protein